ncbi:MAG: lytic transglycosylase domain-containing protein [Elusimicrobia bacterium]|nr:lytic transglycosylase domain-containing protein [Elusimicrobiota bacterium]
MTRILLAAAVMLTAAAAQAQTLDCRNPDRGRTQPRAADFAAWRWHTTALASSRTKCFVQNRIWLATVRVEQQDLHGWAMDFAQTEFAGYRAEFDALETGAGRAAALRRWKAEILGEIQRELEGHDERLRPVVARKEEEKAEAKRGLRQIADGEYASDDPNQVLRTRSDVTVVGKLPEDATTTAPEPKPVQLPAAAGAREYDAVFESEARNQSIDPRVLRSLCHAESSFRADARSSKGAMGYCQLMPATARSLGITNPDDPRESIRGAARVLRENLDRYGTYPLAIAAYNSGWQRVDAHLEEKKPLYRETRTLLSRVRGLVGTVYWDGLPTYRTTRRKR